jgi:hypothetical protein
MPATSGMVSMSKTQLRRQVEEELRINARADDVQARITRSDLDELTAEASALTACRAP